MAQSPLDAAEIDVFRDQILNPILKAIETRGLAGQIDCVAYSADFPYRIDAQKDFGQQKFGLGFAPFGSINSLTYLWQLVMVKQANPMQMEANFYYSRSPGTTNPPPSRAFHLSTAWNKQGEPVEKEGQHHLLSTMLGVTVGRGNSVSEVIDYLNRSVAADATSPKGTIYYCATEDVRTKVREPLFNQAIFALQRLGVTADIVNRAMPEGKKNVQGLVCGTANVNWADTGSTLLKGAICDNLTSTGGLLHDSGRQTSICEFLRRRGRR